MSERVHDQPHGHAHTHQTHDAIIKRLKRADGHLRARLAQRKVAQDKIRMHALHELFVS